MFVGNRRWLRLGWLARPLWGQPLLLPCIVDWWLVWEVNKCLVMVDKWSFTLCTWILAYLCVRCNCTHGNNDMHNTHGRSDVCVLWTTINGLVPVICSSTSSLTNPVAITMQYVIYTHTIVGPYQLSHLVPLCPGCACIRELNFHWNAEANRLLCFQCNPAWICNYLVFVIDWH